MASLAARRVEVATALASINGLRMDADGVWPDRANLPAALLRPDDDSRPMNLTMTDWSEALELVVAVSSRAGLKRGQVALDDLYDDVRTALVTNLAALTNLVRTAYGVIEIDGVEYIGFVLRLEVIDQ